jgi:hypothetical protein
LTPLKILVERSGLLLSITTKHRAYFFFLSAFLIGVRIGPTTDPNPGIVEVSGYDIKMILRNWNTLANLKLRGRKVDYTAEDYREISSGQF